MQEVVSKETIKVLWKGQYCVINDVVDKHGKPQLGKRELRVGPCSFFLHPGKNISLLVNESFSYTCTLKKQICLTSIVIIKKNLLNNGWCEIQPQVNGKKVNVGTSFIYLWFVYPHRITLFIEDKKCSHGRCTPLLMIGEYLLRFLDLSHIWKALQWLNTPV